MPSPRTTSVAAVVIGLLAALAASGRAGADGVPAETYTETYTKAEAVFLQRDNQSTDQPLAEAGGIPLLTTGQLQFPVQPGLRLFHGDVDCDGSGWEAGYLGVWNMFAQAEATGAADIQAPDPLALLVPDFNDRSQARATYASTLNTIELNLFTRSFDGGFHRSAAQPWRRCDGYCAGTWDWLAGFRWAGIDEAAGISFAGGTTPVPSGYTLRSSTNLFGLQAGGRGRMEWDRWAVEGWAKAAVAGSAMSQSQNAIANAVTPDPPVRQAQTATEAGVGFIGDLHASIVYRLTESWGVRAGYNLLWISGAALAPNQFDFGPSSTSGSALHGGSGMFLHGASLGLEARW
jgi:hypothetical protein